MLSKSYHCPPHSLNRQKSSKTCTIRTCVWVTGNTTKSIPETENVESFWVGLEPTTFHHKSNSNPVNTRPWLHPLAVTNSPPRTTPSQYVSHVQTSGNLSAHAGFGVVCDHFIPVHSMTKVGHLEHSRNPCLQKVK